MKKNGSKARKRKRDRWGNRMAIMGITLVVFCLGVVVNVRITAMEKKDLEYQERELLLQQQYDRNLAGLRI